MIHLFCALACEAQPLIQHFKLTELKQFNFFRIYQSENKETSLTITGIGKLNSASAISYHHACIKSNTSDIWLNIGVAGHRNITIGEARLVNKITDEHDGTHWYPQIIFKAPCESTNLITLTKPSTHYQDALFDMEASAFYQMAIRLGTAELIHCLKVVSDNTEAPAAKVNTDKVKTLIADQKETIEKLILSLNPLAEELSSISNEPEYFSDFIGRWHFTQSEKTQLSRLIRHWEMRLKKEDIMQAVAESKTGKTVLNVLREKIDASEFMIHD
jgi:hypothetical protein